MEKEQIQELTEIARAYLLEYKRLFDEAQAHRSIVLSYSYAGLSHSELQRRAEADPVVFDGLLEKSSRLLRQREPLPDELADWLSAYLNNEKVRPRKHGPDPRARKSGNWFIAGAVETLAQQGISATRRDHSTKISACDIVANVLIEEGLRTGGYDAVKAIWQKHVATWKDVENQLKQQGSEKDRLIKIYRLDLLSPPLKPFRVWTAFINGPRCSFGTPY